MKWQQKLMDQPDNDLGLGGGGGGSSDAGANSLGLEIPAGEDNSSGLDTSGGDHTPASGTSAPVIDYAQLAQANQAALAPLLQSLQAANQPQPQAMTDEEFRRQTKHYAPNIDLVKAMFGEGATDETRLQALQSFVSGMQEHHQTLLSLVAQHIMQQQESGLAPFREQQVQAQKREFQEALVNDFPELGAYSHVMPNLLPQAVMMAKNSGVLTQQSTVADARRVTAQCLAALIKQFGNAIQPLRQVSAPARNGMPKMASMTGGGSGSSAGGGGKKEAWQNIFPS